MAEALTRGQVLAALDAGTLQMMRPWGDFVPVRRRSKVRHCERACPDRYVAIVWMEAEVEGFISHVDERHGFPFLRIASGGHDQ